MEKFKATPMKIVYAFFATLLMFSTLAFRYGGGVITGKLEGQDGTAIKILYRYNGKDFIDSTSLKGNQFSLKIALPENVLCTLSNSANQQIKIFIAENTTINVTGSVAQFHALKIDDASENSLFESFKSKSHQLSGEYRKALDASGADRKDKNNPHYVKYQSRLDSLTLNFVKNNSESTAASLAMIDTYLGDAEKKRAATAYKLLSAKAKNGVYAKRIKQFIDTEIAIKKGNLAPNFVLNDFAKKPVSLKDYRGRFVFLDFWASWCPPCRAENPFLKQLQSKYGKDIEFVSVSMDASETAWKLAVRVDRLTWTQLNDPRSTNGEVADSYGIKALPFSCIVDPDGKIVATKLRGHELEQFLSAMFDKPKGK